METINDLVDFIFANRLRPVEKIATEAVRIAFSTALFGALINRTVSLTGSSPKKALQLADIAVRLSELKDDEQLQMMALWGLSWAQSANFQLDEALINNRKMVDYFQAQQNWLRLAGVQINQILILRQLGRFNDAILLEKQARSNCQKAGSAADNYLLNLELNSTSVYLEQGQYEMASGCIERGAQLAQSLNQPFASALLSLQRGQLLSASNQFTQAETAFLDALSGYQKLDMQIEVARVQLNLGRLLHRAGRYQRALRYLESARAGFSSSEQSLAVAYVDLERSHIYLQLNLLEETIHYAMVADRFLKKHKMRFYRVEALLNLAAAYRRRGALELAETIFARARRIIRPIGATHVLHGIDLQRAQLAIAQGKLISARRIARRLAKVVDSGQSPALAAEIELVLAQCTAQPEKHIARATELGEAFSLTGIMIETLRLTGQKAQADEKQRYYQRAIDLVEMQCDLLALDEFRIGYLSNKQPVLDEIIGVAWDAGDENWLLSTLERVHRLSLPTPRMASQAIADDSKLGVLRAEWRWYQSRLHEQQTGLSTREPLQDGEPIYERLKELEHEIAELLRRRRMKGRRAVNNRYSAETSSLSTSLQAALTPDEAIIHYLLVGGACHAVVITPEKITRHPNIATALEVQELLEAWRFFVQHVRPNQFDPTRMAQLYLNDMYQLIWQPIAASVAETAKISIVMPVSWHDLPLCSLFDGNQYLIEQVQINHLATPGSFLQMKKARATATYVSPKHALILAHTDNKRLPFTLEEAHNIGQTLQSHWKTTCLTEEAATVATFMALAQSANLLHFATHARFRADNPLFSWFQLADGYVTVMDLYDIRLPQRPLVVLSACDTGRGEPRGGGLAGMGRGFLTAGASAVIMSRWQVEDESAARLMQQFYALWNGDHSNAPQALRAAQLAILTTGKNPFKWGAGYLCLKSPTP